MVRLKNIEENLVYCICPYCNTVREKKEKKLTIIKKGKERNKLARFLCMNCKRWFNEKTGNSMKWYERD